MKRYIFVLLAVFVFVLGMADTKTADAAKVTADEVSRLVTVKPRNSNETKSAPIKMHVMLENIDLHAYAKYTAELRKNAKYGHIVFAKAAPGSQVSITAEAGVIPGLLSKPAKDMNYSETVNYYSHKKIETLKDLTPTGKVNGFDKKYTIPKDVEEVTAYVSVTYHVGFEVGKDMKASTGTYRQEPAIARHYYIFTSDEACKKAYDLMTSTSVTGTIASALGGDKKSNANSDNKQAGNASESKESGGLSTAVKIAIAVVVLGAIGFGAYQLFGKGRGNAGKGAGESKRTASGPQQPGNFVYTPPAAGPQQTQRDGSAMGNAAGPQQRQIPGAAMGNAAGPQQRQRNGAAMGNAVGTVTYCKQCGAPLRPGSRFCKNCGARNTPKFCKKCGAKLEPDNMFCGNCGSKL